MKLARFGIAALILLAKPCFADDIVLPAPEIAIRELQTDINNIQRQLDTHDVAVDALSNAANALSSEASYSAALKAFPAGDSRACIRLLNSYLNSTQDPQPDKHLAAMHMLGFSYEQIGYKQNALRAYLRYIETVTTEQAANKEQLIEVIRRTTGLLKVLSSYPENDKRKLFSAITGLSLGDEERAEVLLYAAEAASDIISPEVAEAWLAEASKLTKRSDLSARIEYQLAFLYNKSNKVAKAEEYLNKVRTAKDLNLSEIRDLASLTLARIYYKRSNVIMAARYYDEIPSESPYYRAALFEKVFALAEAKDYGKALERAEEYLKTFPKAKNAFSIQATLGLLQLEAQKYDDAERNLSAAVKEIGSMHRNTLNELESEHGFDASFLKSVDAQRLIDLPEESLSKFFIRLSDKIVGLKASINESQQELFTQTFGLNQLSLYQIKPQWGIRAEHYAKQTIASLLIGSKLNALSRSFADKSLSPLEKQKLVTINKEKKEVLSVLSDLKRKHVTWKKWENYLLLFKGINQSIAKIEEAQSLLSAHNLAAVEHKNLLDEANRQKAQADQLLSASMLQAKDLVIEKTRNHADLGLFNEDLRLFKQYSDLLHEESDLLFSALDKDQRHSLHFAKEDIRNIWKTWLGLSKNIVVAYADFHSTISEELAQKADTLNTLYAKQSNLQTQLLDLQKSYENKRHSSKSAIYDELTATSANELARYKKWLSDIQWMRAKEIREQQTEFRGKLALELEAARSQIQ